MRVIIALNREIRARGDASLRGIFANGKSQRDTKLNCTFQTATPLSGHRRTLADTLSEHQDSGWSLNNDDGPAGGSDARS
jgi:hypothetical protein